MSSPSMSGVPREVEWRGKDVRTAIWKEPVHGSVLANRLNLIGDGASRSFRSRWRAASYHGLSARFLPLLRELSSPIEFRLRQFRRESHSRTTCHDEACTGTGFRRPIVRTRGPRWLTPASPTSGAVHRRQTAAELGLAAVLRNYSLSVPRHRRDVSTAIFHAL
jgi:hypothetical protein